MDERQKLLTVVHHWIEHNESHLDEYRKWGERASRLGLETVRANIEAAVEKLSESNSHLRKALKTMESEAQS